MAGNSSRRGAVKKSGASILRGDNSGLGQAYQLAPDKVYTWDEIAERKLKSVLPPHAALDLEALCQWLAASLRMEYRHIDPDKADYGPIRDFIAYKLTDGSPACSKP